jgi:hypothetical protein
VNDRELTEDEIIERYKETGYIEEMMRPIPEPAADAARADLERRTVELLRELKIERDANARDHYMNAECCPTCDVVALLAEWEARR